MIYSLKWRNGKSQFQKHGKTSSINIHMRDHVVLLTFNHMWDVDPIVFVGVKPPTSVM